MQIITNDSYANLMNGVMILTYRMTTEQLKRKQSRGIIANYNKMYYKKDVCLGGS